MLVRDALVLAEGLVAKHLPGQGWRVRVSRSTWYAGLCDFKTKTITLSARAVQQYSDEEVVETTLHEIGHALAGPGVGHGKAWAAAVRRVGGTPKKYAPPIRGGLTFGAYGFMFALVYWAFTNGQLFGVVVASATVLFLAWRIWRAVGPISRVYKLCRT